jgi:hypothetical protein
MSRSIDAAVSLNAGLQCRIGDASNGILSKTRDQWLEGREACQPSVQTPTKFELVINIKTAKAVELNIPAAFPLRADEVIE